MSTHLSHARPTATSELALAEADGSAHAGKIRVLFAGDMDFARAQFAAEAPQLALIPMADGLAARSADRPPERGPAAIADVAFIDCAAPHVNAPVLLEELRRLWRELPVVIAVDPGRDRSPRAAVELGADDYTVKSPGWLVRLSARLELVIARHRRLAQLEALRTIEQRLRTVVESAPICLTRVDREGTIMAMNTAARSMVGATESGHVLRKPFFSFVGADCEEAARRLIGDACQGQAGSLRLSIADVSGASRTVEMSAVTLPPGGDTPASALLVLRDISGWVRLEQSVLENGQATDEAGSGRADGPLHEPEQERRLTELAEQGRQLADQRDRLLAEANQSQRHALEVEAERDSVLEQCKVLRKAVEGLRAEAHARASDRDVELAELRGAIDQLRVRHAKEMSAVVSANSEQERRRQDADRPGHRLAAEVEASRPLEALKARFDQIERERQALEAALSEAKAQAAAERTAADDVRRMLELQLDDAGTAHAEMVAERDRALALARTGFERLGEWALARARLVGPVVEGGSTRDGQAARGGLAAEERDDGPES
jgi:PAS domain S-box-containing protein